VAKALCDSYCTNAHYARVGGISTQELNTLELEFLFLVDWNLFCPVSQLQKYYVHLVQQSEGIGFVSIDNDDDLGYELLDDDAREVTLPTYDTSEFVI
jgi:hypothetical protein